MDILGIAGETSIQPVGLDIFDDHPGPYCMSFGSDLTPLVKSIQGIGLINSPIVIDDNSGGMTIVAGYRRIQALKTLGCPEVLCRIFSGPEPSVLQCLRLNLYDNLATRKLNPVEKSMLLNRLAPLAPTSEILDHYMPLLDLPSHEATLSLYIKIEGELDQRTKEYLASGRISLQVTRMLLALDSDARTRAFGLISDLRLNINQQKQMLEYLYDISHASHESVSQLLDGSHIKQICSDTRLNNPQKAKALLKVLKVRRFPLLSSAEDTFKKMVSRLDLPKGVRIDPPPFFEAPHYRAEVLFRNGRELREKIETLSMAEGLEELGDPWERRDS